MSSSSKNLNRPTSWITVGAVSGFCVILGTFFVLSSLSDLDEDDKMESNYIGFLNSSDQSSSTPLAIESDPIDSDTLTLDNPLEDEWNELVSDEHLNAMQLADLVRIAKEWMDEDGFDVIPRILESLINPIVQDAVVLAIFYHAMQTDAEAALQYALRFSGTVQELALSAVVTAWVNLNPIQAMEAISAIEAGSIRRKLLEMLVRTWAEKDSATVLEDLALIPANLRKLGEREALLALARTAPERTVAILEGISTSTDGELKFTLTLELASSWSDQDPNAALEWALSSNTFIRNQVLTTVLGKLAQEDPKFALHTALTQPIDENMIGLELAVISEVATSDLELAVEMLYQVRDGLTKKFSYIEVGKALVRNNETNRALSLALEVQDDEQGTYYNHIVHQWARTNPKSLVAYLENLPSIGVKNQAAMSLESAGRNILSETQMEYVRNFLAENLNSDSK